MFEERCAAGNGQIFIKGVTEMNTEVDEIGRLKVCAHCGETCYLPDEDVRHCMYCGYSILNHCTSYGECGKYLPPQAAFCIYCGSESHFLRSGLVNSKRQTIINDDDLPF